jgi:hypothetical protein
VNSTSKKLAIQNDKSKNIENKIEASKIARFLRLKPISALASDQNLINSSFYFSFLLFEGKEYSLFLRHLQR